MQRGVDAREIEIAARAPRNIHVAHRLERHAREQPQPPALGLDEGVDRDVVRNVVRERRQGEHQNYGRSQRDDHAPHKGVDNDFPSVEHSGSAAYNGKGSQ